MCSRLRDLGLHAVWGLVYTVSHFSECEDSLNATGHINISPSSAAETWRGGQVKMLHYAEIIISYSSVLIPFT